MSRRHRDLVSSTVFHVTNRGNDRQDIFSLEADWHCFERELVERCEIHGVRVLIYAWMTNHFHAVVECEDPSVLPELMRDFQSRYARSYNHRTERSGSLFEKPYYSRPIVDDDDLLCVGRYVHLNPAAIVGERALPNYRWSSLGVYLQRRAAPDWLDTRRLGALVDPERYLEDLRRRHRWDRLPLGDAPARTPTTLDEIIDVVSRSELVGGTHDRNAMICHLAVETGAADTPELSARMGIDRSTARRRARSVRVRVSTDSAVEHLRDRLLDEIAAQRG